MTLAVELEYIARENRTVGIQNVPKRRVLVKQDTKAARFGRYFRVSPILFWGFILCVVTAVPASAQQQTPQPQQQAKEHQQHNSDLPAGPGKDTFVRVCSKCHSPNNVMANGQNQQGWENTITKMVGFGATGTDAEFSEILDYLVKNFPPPTGATANGNSK